jgi:hypothetical protein
MYYNLICILYALLCGQKFILVKSGCYIFRMIIRDVSRTLKMVVRRASPLVRTCEGSSHA